MLAFLNRFADTSFGRPFLWLWAPCNYQFPTYLENLAR